MGKENCVYCGKEFKRRKLITIGTSVKTCKRCLDNRTLTIGGKHR